MSANEQLKNASILIVEDDPEALEALAIIVRSLVGTVYKAENGAVGLEMARKHHPDIILSDLEMPVMDGMTMIKAIKAERPAMPVVVVTIFHDEEHRVPEADRMVYKPIDRKLLRSAILEMAEHLPGKDAS